MPGSVAATKRIRKSGNQHRNYRKINVGTVRVSGWLRFRPGNGYATLLLRAVAPHLSWSNRLGVEFEVVGTRREVEAAHRMFKGRSMVDLRCRDRTYRLTAMDGSGQSCEVTHVSNPLEQSDEPDGDAADGEDIATANGRWELVDRPVHRVISRRN